MKLINSNIEVDTSDLFGFFDNFFKKRRIIRYLLENGAVLTGSRALKCYKIGEKSIIDRDPHDWDFIMTRKQFKKMCKDYKIYDADLNTDKYHMNRSFSTIYSAYGDISYLFPCHIQIVINNDLGSFTTTKDGINLSTLSEIIEYKEHLCSKNGKKKHMSDINNIYLNLMK